MRQTRLKNTSDNDFHKAWKLYEDAFPLEERRSLSAQVSILKKDNYNFDVLNDGKQFIGFILWWDFETYRYIDHFATVKTQRNKGFGKLILTQFMSNNEKPILLEVDLPTSLINKRRIKFYERLGYKLNQHYYEIPQIEEDQAPFQLLIMSYPNPIYSVDLEQFVKKCHPVIFNIIKNKNGNK